MDGSHSNLSLPLCVFHFTRTFHYLIAPYIVSCNFIIKFHHYITVEEKKVKVVFTQHFLTLIFLLHREKTDA